MRGKNARQQTLRQFVGSGPACVHFRRAGGFLASAVPHGSKPLPSKDAVVPGVLVQTRKRTVTPKLRKVFGL